MSLTPPPRRGGKMESKSQNGHPQESGNCHYQQKVPRNFPTLTSYLVFRKRNGVVSIRSTLMLSRLAPSALYWDLQRYESLVATRNARIAKYQPSLKFQHAVETQIYIDVIAAPWFLSWDPNNDTVFLR
ncbi:hypothetical protein TNCT_5921 [Trichonephila clavata]|uniref:Uncharacterized protein n=1 Tax=Trichonephila clavata TaxID=2740835 RepID=A0A8X6LSA7_TRICU|nr:hypothetical protein TNCT_5921 [Trichonephila clavata]